MLFRALFGRPRFVRSCSPRNWSYQIFAKKIVGVASRNFCLLQCLFCCAFVISVESETALVVVVFSCNVVDCDDTAVFHVIVSGVIRVVS